MGGGGSTTIKQNLNMSMLNEMLYKSVEKNESITSNDIENVQNMEIEYGTVIGCNIETEQTSESSIMTNTQQIVNSFKSVENELASAMQAQVSGALDKQTQMGNLQFGDRQNIEQNINNEIKNIVTTEMKTENLTKVINNAVNVQNQKVYIDTAICNDGETHSFKQDISADIAAQTVSQNILSATTQNKVINDIVAETEATLSTKAGGVAEVVDSVGNAFSGPFMYAAIASVACALILVVALVALGRSPAGQNAMRSGKFPGMK